MAAATIPLITAAIPLLTPIITNLIQHVESLFGAKTGETKFKTVLDAVTAIAGQLSTAGKLPGVLDPSTLAQQIEVIVQDLKSKGQLPAPTVAQKYTASGVFTLSPTT